MQELNDEEFLIFVIAAVFLEELEQEPIPVDRLKQLVHPVTYRDWGSFIEAQDFINGLTDIGLSSRIRFNSRHDIAYVYMLENVTDSFLIEASQIISDAKVINLVAINEKDWRIYSIGGLLEDYLVKVSPLEELRKIASKLLKKI